MDKNYEVDLDQLKCCGNCINMSNYDMGNYVSIRCSTYKENVYSYNYCDQWEFVGSKSKIKK